MKSEVLLETREAFPGRSLCWLDIDARVRAVPSLLDGLSGQADVAFHRKDDKELLGGTLWFSDSKAANELLRSWDQRNKKQRTVWDQRNLDACLTKTWKGRQVILPPEYCQIFDTMAAPGRQPVFEHMQASRRLKDTI